MISFNEIPIDIRVPGHYIEIDNTRALQGLATRQHKILVLGQRVASGTVAAGVPTRMLSAAQGEESFGRGAMLSTMLNALKSANSYTNCYALALDDDGAGVAATGSISFGGAATAAKTLNIYIGGQRVRVAVASGDAPAAVATALAAAINAETDLPVTAVAASDACNLTARNAGEEGNSIDLRHSYYLGEGLAKGLTCTITAMSGGSGNPDIADAIAAMGDEQYDTIIMPWNDASNLAALEAELTKRWGPMIQKEGMAFAAKAGSHAAISTLGDSRNSPHLCIMGCQQSPTLPWVIAAVVGAVDAYEPDPARPRQTLTLTGVLASKEEDRYTQEERNLHLHDGISTFKVDAGGNVLIERLITSYQTNAFGVEDISYLDVTTLRTLAYLRYTVRARIALRFPRHKLADDGTNFGPGQAIVTPSVIRAELIALFKEWELAGLAEDIEQFKSELIVQRNSADPNRVDAIIPPDVVNQFRVLAASVQFRL